MTDPRTAAAAGPIAPMVPTDKDRTDRLPLFRRGGANLDGLLLLLVALRAEGRTPRVLPRTEWVRRRADFEGLDYVLVEDETWRAWRVWTEEETT